jgi:hypothetical protein
MMRRVLPVAVLLFLLAASAGAQEVSTVIVPVAGNIIGPESIRWMTDIELSNDTALDLDVAIELSAAPDAPAFFLTLAPGQSQRYSDLVGQAFGIDGTLSPLRITTGGRRPVTVRAHAYALRGLERSPLQPIDIYSTDTYFPLRVLDGLEFSDDRRTNIGLVNFGDQDVDFVLHVQRIAGRDIAVTPVRVRAGSMVHTSIQSLFPLIAKGSGFSVVVETGARDTHVYASVIENETNGARFIAPRLGSR